MNKRIYSILVLLILVLSLASQAIGIDSTLNPTVAFTGEVQSSRFVLKCEKQTGNISIVDKKTSQEYFGVPKNAKGDPSTGLFKMGLMSQLIVRGVNTITNQLADIMSYTSSVKKNNVVVEQLADGFKVTYTFATEKIVIPVLFKIDDFKFQAQIDVNEITEGEKVIVKEVELLPYFGAGGLEDKGFMLIPDGSGAVINFNNNKANLGDYSAKIYGRDDSFYLKQQPLETQDIKLPILGIEKNGFGFLAVIEEGAAAGKIVAAVSGNKTGYNNAYFGFTIHSTDTVYINKDTWYEKGVLKYNTNKEIEKVDVSYNFYEEENGGINSMAAIYREILKTDKKPTTSDTRGLFVNIICAMNVNKSVLGIPVNLVQPLTTFTQTKDIIDVLKSKGITNISVKLTNSTNEEVNTKIVNGFHPLGKLGNKAKLEDLLKTEGVIFYPNVDIQKFDAGILNISALFNGVKSLSNETSIKYSYDIATYNIKTSARKIALLKIKQYSSTLNKVINDLKKYTSNISVGGLGSELYSDFNKRSVYSRQQAMNEIKRNYRETLTDMKILSYSPNDYAIPYTDVSLEIPDRSSGYDIFDYDIPFYGIVLNGISNFSYQSINLQADDETFILKNMEVGALPLYTLFYQKSEAIKETDYAMLFSCNYLQWIDHAKETFESLENFKKISGNSAIKTFVIVKKDVHKIEYKNGAIVIFNLSQSDESIDGVIVKSKSYQIIDQGVVIK